MVEGVDLFEKDEGETARRRLQSSLGPGNKKAEPEFVTRANEVLDSLTAREKSR